MHFILAGQLKDNTREIDCVARWGGEEFALILPNTDCEGALHVAERLRKAVSSQNHLIDITLSLGVITTQGETEVEELIKTADKALYKAKQNKNTVFSIKQTGCEHFTKYES